MISAKKAGNIVRIRAFHKVIVKENDLRGKLLHRTRKHLGFTIHKKFSLLLDVVFQK